MIKLGKNLKVGFSTTPALFDTIYMCVDMIFNFLNFIGFINGYSANSRSEYLQNFTIVLNGRKKNV